METMTAEIYTGLMEAKRRQYLMTISPDQMERAMRIKKAICDKLGISLFDAESATRKREVVMCRQFCMYFIQKKTTVTLKEIGGMFGNRDHSTVIYARDTVDGLMKVDIRFSKSVTDIEHMLNFGNL